MKWNINGSNRSKLASYTYSNSWPLNAKREARIEPDSSANGRRLAQIIYRYGLCTVSSRFSFFCLWRLSNCSIEDAEKEINSYRTDALSPNSPMILLIDKCRLKWPRFPYRVSHLLTNQSVGIIDKRIELAVPKKEMTFANDYYYHEHGYPISVH